MIYEELKIKFPGLSSIIEEYYETENKNSCEPKKLLIELIEDKLGNNKNFRNTWIKGILKEIEIEIGYKTQDLTFGFIPNYGGMVELSNEIEDRKRHITQIQFYLSLLKDVYSIQIVEIEETIEYNRFLKKEAQNQTNKGIYVSPSNHECKEIYCRIESFFESFLANPVFLPYSLQQVALPDVFMPHTTNESNTVGNAFFRKILPLNEDYDIFGDFNYRINELP